MTYNPGIPQPRDIPSASQAPILSDFKLLNDYFNVNHVPFAGIIAVISRSNPCRVGSFKHTLITGDQVTFYNLDETTGMQNLNGNTYTITVINESSFSLDGVDSTNFPVYQSGGNYSSAQLKYGFHKYVNFASAFDTDPNSVVGSTLYPKKTDNVANLYYQNGATSAFVKPLTNLTRVQTSENLGPEGADNGFHNGFKTPWGLIVNMGTIRSTTVPMVNYTFAIPFTTQVYTLIGTAQLLAFFKEYKTVMNVVSNTQFQGGVFDQNGKLDPNQIVNYLAIGK